MAHGEVDVGRYRELPFVKETPDVDVGYGDGISKNLSETVPQKRYDAPPDILHVPEPKSREKKFMEWIIGCKYRSM